MENKKTKPLGRPAKFSKPEDLEQAINKYFKEECRNIPTLDEDGHVLTTKTGKPLIEYNPPTLAGLAISLGFADRQSLYDYAKKEKFSFLIRQAIARMEDYAEKQLTIGQASGAIFWLKNHGWNEKEKPQSEMEKPKTQSLSEMGIDKKDIIKLAKNYK